MLARAVRRISGASARRRKTTILLWLLFVIGCSVAGGMTGTQLLTDSESGTGQSARADARVEAAGLERPASEQILVRSGDASATAAAAADLERRLERLPAVGEVKGPRDTPALSTAGGRTVLVVASLRGDPDDAKEHVAPVEAAVAAVAGAHPNVTTQEAGAGTIGKTFDEVIEKDLQRAELISLPITLLILILAFGAIVAASVPLLLGLTSVAAAMGALGVVSQVVPSDQSSGSLVVLIGLAVGVDYSLFAIRREREERRAGREKYDALAVTASTVGRAIVVSGLTVMVALAGLLFTGLAIFTAMALATIIVVAIAVIGSVTVLPAVLSLFGDKINKGRIPFLGRRQPRTGGGVWGALARVVTRRPVAALVTAVCLMGALAVPAMDMKPASTGDAAFPADQPVMAAQRQIERAFPGAPSDAEIVVTGRDLDGAAAQKRLRALGRDALEVTGGRGAVSVETSRAGGTAVVSVPMPDHGEDAAARTVDALRDRVPEGAMVDRRRRAQRGLHRPPGHGDPDRHRLRARSCAAAARRGLPLAGPGRGRGRPQPAVGRRRLRNPRRRLPERLGRGPARTSRILGTVSDWVPLFSFVILFGLSMDYTILVLERIREARRAGLPARAAAAEGVSATAGAVTSAAIVMVAVFAVFGTMTFVDTKQLGVGLAAAVLLDATIVRGIALPALVALLGDRRWRVRPAARRGWDDARAGSATVRPTVVPASGDAR